MADRFDLINFSKSVTTTLGGTTANVNIDANTLFVDGTNNRVGVNTIAPSSTLEVSINSTQEIGARVRNLTTTQFAGAGTLCIGPAGSGAQGATAFYHFNVNTGGTQGAMSIAQFNESGSFVRGIAQYNYNSQAWSLLTNGTERLGIDSSGRVTKPAQPAFNATIPFSTNGAIWPDNNTSFVNYVSTHLNRGSHFNATNGRFTAPVAGAYLFCASLTASSGTGTDLNDYQISINDTPSENYSPPTVLTYPSSIWQSGSITVVLNLAVNDFVTVRRTCCNNNKPGGLRMNFMGCLIG